ncbi:MAG: hypothetical protein AMXMBFR82_04250 [Candidatus Hydrogenedentota bacterium]
MQKPGKGKCKKFEKAVRPYRIRLTVSVRYVEDPTETPPTLTNAVGAIVHLSNDGLFGESHIRLTNASGDAHFDIESISPSTSWSIHVTGVHGTPPKLYDRTRFIELDQTGNQKSVRFVIAPTDLS